MSKGLKITLGFIVVAITGVAAYVFLVFKGSSGHLALVPKNAGFVGVVDFKSLASKLDMEKVKNLKVWKYLEEQKKKSDKKEPMGEVLKDPASSGLDPFSKLCFFAVAEKENDFSGGVVAHLLSASGFEETIKKAEIKSPIEDKGSYKSVKIESGLLIAWNKESALVFGSQDTVNIAKTCETLMNQKKDESILANEDFQKLNEKAFDMAAFVNYEGITKLVEKGAASNPMYNKGSMDALKGSSMYGTLNFEEKRVAVEIESTIKDKEAFEKINYFAANGLSKDHIKTISPDKVYALMAFSVDFKKFLASMSANTMVAEVINSLKMRFGLNDAELQNLLTGEISLALIDFDAIIHPEPAPLTASLNPADPMAAYANPPQPKLPSLSLSASVGDKKAAEKVIAALGLPKNEEGYYTVPTGFLNVYMVETPKGFTFTNGKNIASQLYSQKGFKEVAEPVKSMVTANPTTVYFDLNISHYPKELLEMFKMLNGEEAYAKFNNIMKNFESLSAKGSSFKSSSELLFTPGEGNSLMRLILISDELVPKP